MGVGWGVRGCVYVWWGGVQRWSLKGKGEGGGFLSVEEEEEGHNKDIIIRASTFSYPTFRF